MKTTKSNVSNKISMPENSPMRTTKNDLSNNVRAKSIKMLSASLIDAVDLSMMTKQAHWNVRGPDFIALHELFDKIYTEVQIYVDDLAERITALGGEALAGRQTIAHSRLTAYPKGIFAGEQHLKHLSAALAQFGALVRKDIDSSDDMGDVGTSDLYTAISRQNDKNLWFLEAHLG